MANRPRRRPDPIFGLCTPLLFAHRGGAAERPESTERAFRYALEEVGAEVLELDVQVTKDDERFVVWHGPGLDNVWIERPKTNPRDRSDKENDIRNYSWADLDGNAWVAPPSEEPRDLADIERCEDTRLLLLEEMMQRFPDAPLNIEMKRDSFRLDHVERLVKVIDAHHGDRPILVVSQSRSLIERFRDLSKRRYPTGLSISEVARAFAKAALPGLKNRGLDAHALQSSHAWHLTPGFLVEDAQDAGAAVHVFLNKTSILAGALDESAGTPTQEQISNLLDRGVDGIMTDRPGRVRGLIDFWIRNP